MNCNLSVYLFLSAVLSMLVGCNKPILMSMGTSPMPVYHEPRWSGEQDKKWVVSADAFVGPFGEGLNVRDVFSLGGNLSVMYRFWNPLFVQGAFAGSAGNLKFGCSDIQTAVDLHGIDRNDLTAQPFRQRQCQGGFS